VNHSLANRKLLEWQTGYGVASFGTKATPWVVRYVENQRQHHAKGTTHDRLERVEIERGSPLKRAAWRWAEIAVPAVNGRPKPSLSLA
jgi:hypothetical protein